MKEFRLPDIEEEKSVIKSVRIKSVDMKRIEEVSRKTGHSINRIICEGISYALDNLVLDKIQEESSLDISREEN